MAAKAKLSILGLYRWNNNIFKDMALPEGVDGEILTWKILEDCAELEVLYSDPDYMQASIYNWSSAMLPNWKKMQEALTAEYNPIWNKDGKITETNQYGETQRTNEYGEAKNINDYGKISTNGNADQTVTEKVSGFNASTMANSTQTDTTQTTNAAQEAHTDKLTAAAHTDKEKHNSHTDIRTVIEQGNIGVTESSAMVRHELELRAEFNIYSIIANDFKKHYCLMVY